MDKNLKTKENPLISIMMPVYNGEKYIKEGVESIIRQTVSNWELLIINDCSTDDTEKIVSKFKDSRIKLFTNSKKFGLAKIRQKGIDLSRGRFVAFLDCDDISSPKRLEKQLEFLSEHKDISAVGSWIEVIDETGKKTGKIWRHPIHPNTVAAVLLFRNCITQSSVMIKKEVYQKFSYREEFAPAPDFDLWSRITPDYKIANLPDILTFYRVYNKSLSFRIKKEIEETTKKIFREKLIRLGINLTEEELNLHDGLERKEIPYSNDEILKIEFWLNKLIERNNKKALFKNEFFRSVVSAYYFKILALSASLGFEVLSKYLSSGFEKNFRKGIVLSVLSLFKKKMLFDVTSDSFRKLLGD